MKGALKWAVLVWVIVALAAVGYTWDNAGWDLVKWIRDSSGNVVIDADGDGTSDVSVSGSDGSVAITETVTAANLLMDDYKRGGGWSQKGTSTAADRYTLVSPTRMAVRIDGTIYAVSSQQELDLSAEATWDTTAGTDYRTAANRAGVDFYVYACEPSSGTAPDLIVSANSTVPTGYTAATSYKVGGFHGLCTAVGTIGGHDLTDFAQGDILPDSIWDQSHRPVCSPEGMVYSEAADIWVDIYLASGTGASTASANGGTISDSRNWMDFVDDFGAVGKRLLTDHEFQLIAAGSNEETNIAGSADPVTTGGHSDTAGRRMISDIGVEDACGALWQWLLDQSYRFDGAANHTHDVTVSGDPETATTGNPSGDVAPAWAWENLPGSKGSFFRQGTYGDVKLRAGGYWGGGTGCGSRSRSAIYHRWNSLSSLGARGCARSR